MHFANSGGIPYKAAVCDELRGARGGGGGRDTPTTFSKSSKDSNLRGKADNVYITSLKQ